MKKVILSLTASVVLFACLNVQASDTDPQTAREETQKFIVSSMGAAATIFGVEYFGESVGLAYANRKVIDLAIMCAWSGVVFDKAFLKREALRIPMYIGTVRLVNSDLFTQLIKEIPGFGEKLSELEATDLKMLAAFALYYYVILKNYEPHEKNIGQYLFRTQNF